jgi:dTDP-4-amino-4,6-dideoxygalactose transaminase
MYGFRGDRHAHIEGLNSRLDELQAAILRVKLRRLEKAVAERRRLAGRYLEGLVGLGLGLPMDDGGHGFHLFVVQTDERERLRAALAKAEIGSGVHYDPPVHVMEGYAFLGVERGALPVTERAARRVLSLPLYPGLAPDAVDRVVDVVSNSLRAS